MSDAAEPALEAANPSIRTRASAEEALRLARAFYRVKDSEARAHIIALVERYAAEPIPTDPCARP